MIYSGKRICDTNFVQGSWIPASKIVSANSQDRYECPVARTARS